MAENIYNPFTDEDEIIIKDMSGKFKVLKHGEIIDQSGIASPEKKVEKARNEKWDFQKDAQNLIEEAPLRISDDVIRRRLINILITRFSGVRDTIDTREILTRSSKIGGIGLESAQAEMLLKKIEEKSKKIGYAEPEVLENIPFIAKASRISKPDTFPPPQKKIQKIEEQTQEDILKLIQELPEYKILPTQRQKDVREEPRTGQPSPLHALNNAPATSLPSVAAAPAKEQEFQVPSQTVLSPQKSPAQVVTEKALETRAEEETQSQRTKVKLSGPLDELAELDITELRRLSQDPYKAVKHIEQKLEILEKDSFAQKAQGIAVWRKSPLFKLYVEMGRESIMKKESIENVMESRKINKQPYLTAEECSAIMDVNRQIRF